MSYQRQKEVLEMPNLIEIQKNSYQWFLDEGLKEVFADISPITDFAGHLSLEFVDFTLCKNDIKYTIEECKERDATYAAPLKVKVRLCNKDKDEINEHEIFMGDLPLMTDTGSFVINGAERVIVSQLVRSPGIYYGIAHDKIGTELYSCTVIPNRGAWLEYETDSNDIFYVRVDRTRKVPVTVLIRALGYGTNAEIIDLFGDELKLEKSFEKDPSNNYQDGLLELYKKIRPGEPLSVDSAESLLNSMFFDPRRYDLAKVGRYKFNKKLHFKNRIVGHVLAEDVVDTTTGEILAEQGKRVLLCDFDPQANSTSGMGVDKTVSKGIYEVLVSDVPAADAVVHTRYGDVLPSNKALAGAGIELIGMDRREFLLKDALDQLAAEYDFIFIDCPPSLELLTLNALCAADSILVPVQGEYFALEGLSDLMNTVRIVRRSLNPKLALEGVLLTMFDGRTNLAMQVAEEVKHYFPGKVYATVIPRNVRLSEAPSHGKPITAYDRTSRGAEAYQALAVEFLKKQ